MKILVATPAFGGQVSVRYMLSLIELMQRGSEEDYLIGIRTVSNNSPQARNELASHFLKDPIGWDKLFFIDADQSWNYEQAKLLLMSEKKFIGGTYPVKTLPLSLNFKPLSEHQKYFDGPEKSVAEFNSWVKAVNTPEDEIPVEMLPTGFLLIDRSVLEELAKYAPKYAYPDLTTGELVECYDFFFVGSRNGVYLSEDWGLSLQAKKYGFQPYLNPKCVIKHEGSYLYGG